MDELPPDTISDYRNDANHCKRVPEKLYTPEPLLRSPRKLFLSMWRDLRASRELSWRLFVRNISAQYRQSLMGYFWAFLPPIATMLTFAFLNAQKILEAGDTEIPYPAYVMIGTLLWQGFVDAMNSPVRLITSSKTMLAKINFPREALILAGIGEVLFNFTIRLILMFIVFIWFQIAISHMAILALIGIFSLMGLGLFIGIILTPLGALYQDIERGLAVITTLWFFLTPVVYPPPVRWPASLLAKINPVSPLLITTREMLTGEQLTNPGSFIFLSVLTVLCLIMGWVVYRVAMPHIIERMSS